MMGSGPRAAIIKAQWPEGNTREDTRPNTMIPPGR